MLFFAKLLGQYLPIFSDISVISLADHTRPPINVRWKIILTNILDDCIASYTHISFLLFRLQINCKIEVLLSLHFY